MSGKEQVRHHAETSAAAAAATRKLLAGLWEKNQPILRERLSLLEAATQAAGMGTLTSEQRREAASTAHKLSGSLGMFGFPRGTELARQLEQGFDAATGFDAAAAQDQITALRKELGL